MDRQGHEYAAAMAYAQQQQQQQQQQQYGFHSQHQQFPPSAHGPPFLPQHPSLQQFPYPPRPMQQPQYPHPPPHPHMIHIQQQQRPNAFLPHVPPHVVAPPPFHGPYDSVPPHSPPPSDPELQKRIDKLVEYSAKNGPEFEAMIREKQQENPDYAFLFGGEGHNYYRYKLWMVTRQAGGPQNPSFPAASVPTMHPPNPVMSPSPLNVPPLGGQNAAAASSPVINAPHLHQTSFPPFFEQQHPHNPQPFIGQSRTDYDQSYRSFRGLSRPLPSDVELELSNVLSSLTGTKESIKGAKNWFIQRSAFAPVLAEALRDRIFALDDAERQLHIIYVANDILFDSFQRRPTPHELDNEALAFRPVLGSMIARIYHNPQNKEENQSRLQKILQFWASKEVYDQDTIHGLENDMMRGPPMNVFPVQRDMRTISPDPSTGIPNQMANPNLWQVDRQSPYPVMPEQEYREKPFPPVQLPLPHQQFPHSVPTMVFPGSSAIPLSGQPANQLPAATAAGTEKLPPYPLFPPGLIPGMVRKMQIGSGVPYSPMSPLDIPTVIPPSNVSPSEILERVSKFFREIGEVNPSEGPMKSSNDDYDDYGRDSPVRKGGACIPPPAGLQVDSESGTYPDGSVERKPGSSDSGRLGLGASANPNEASQYDDVYSSYRKQRSSNYHTSISARAVAR